MWMREASVTLFIYTTLCIHAQPTLRTNDTEKNASLSLAGLPANSPVSMR
jgi:hypothetical protein